MKEFIVKEVLDAGLYTKDNKKIMDLTKETREELIGKKITTDEKEQRC